MSNTSNPTKDCFKRMNIERAMLDFYLKGCQLTAI